MSNRVAFTRLESGVLSEFPVGNDHLHVTAPEHADCDTSEYAFGEFEYESDALFGSPTVASGPYVYHYPTQLFGFVSEAGAFTMSRGPIEQLRELCAVAGLPDIEPSDGHALYREQGRGPYSVRFTDTLKTYDRDTRHASEFDPEKETELNAQESRDVSVSEAYVNSLVDEAISEKGMYVASAKVSADGIRVTYDAPLCFLTDDTSKPGLQAVTKLAATYFTEWSPNPDSE